MATRYRLPDALGGGECVVHDKDRWHGPDRYVRATVGEGDEAFTIDLHLGLLTAVKLPPEPPTGYYLLEHGTNMWPLLIQHQQGYGWYEVGSTDVHTWDEVVARYPNATFTELVPDPFAEPVELPWKDGHGVEVSQTRTDTGMSDQVYVSTKGASYGFAHLKPVVARQMANALLAAADAAEKEQS